MVKNEEPSADQEALRRIAFHEAGHALAFCILKRRFQFVTIIPDPDADGQVVFTRFPTTSDPIRGSSDVIIHLAGGIAQAIALGDPDSDVLWRVLARRAESDFDLALEVALTLVGSKEQSEAFVRWMIVRTRELLEFPVNRILLDAITVELLTHKTLTYSQVRRIISDIRPAESTWPLYDSELGKAPEERWSRFTAIVTAAARQAFEAKYSNHGEASDG